MSWFGGGSSKKDDSASSSSMNIDSFPGGQETYQAPQQSRGGGGGGNFEQELLQLQQGALTQARTFSPSLSLQHFFTVFTNNNLVISCHDDM
jgi:hypothetical protein